jgi:type III secretory pathway component EscS
MHSEKAAVCLPPVQACNNTTPCPINCTGAWQVLNASACTGTSLISLLQAKLSLQHQDICVSLYGVHVLRVCACVTHVSACIAHATW